MTSSTAQARLISNFNRRSLAMRHIFVLGGLLVLLAATAAARAEVDPFEAFRCERAFDEARFAKADKICRPLAEAGLADAQAIMGLLYQDGRGVTRDYTEAALWYDRAARQGHREAQFNLGTMYRYGVGVARDLVEAYAWLDVAAGAGHTDAVAGRALVEKRMTTEQRDEGRRRAAELGRVVANAAAPPPAEAAQPRHRRRAATPPRRWSTACAPRWPKPSASAAPIPDSSSSFAASRAPTTGRGV